MPSTLPRSVRDAWGEEAAEDFAAWFDESIQQRTVHRDEWREVLSRLDVVEEHLEHIDEELSEQRRETGELRGEMSRMRREMNERFDAINERFDHQSAQFDQRLDQMGAQFDQRLDQMGAQFDQRLDVINEAMRRQTRWTVGAIIVIGAILSALLSIAEFAA